MQSHGSLVLSDNIMQSHGSLVLRDNIMLSCFLGSKG